MHRNVGSELHMQHLHQSLISVLCVSGSGFPVNFFLNKQAKEECVCVFPWNQTSMLSGITSFSWCIVVFARFSSLNWSSCLCFNHTSHDHKHFNKYWQNVEPAELKQFSCYLNSSHTATRLFAAFVSTFCKYSNAEKPARENGRLHHKIKNNNPTPACTLTHTSSATQLRCVNEMFWIGG